ncbi:MAG: hypothetical protein AAGH19_08230, partial [Pseudomonadota bacterium]
MRPVSSIDGRGSLPPERRWCASGVLCALLLGLAPWVSAWATDLPGGGQLQEYFVRQNAGEAVLVRIDGQEAIFEAVISTIEGEVLVASGTPGSRIAPLFQYVPSPSSERQLDIRVTAPLDTDRSRFDMGLSRITVRDDRTGRLARAYQLLSFGLELPPADTAANWSVKIGALLDAASLFESFGMEELQTWSAFYASLITLQGLVTPNLRP